MGDNKRYSFYHSKVCARQWEGALEINKKIQKPLERRYVKLMSNSLYVKAERVSTELSQLVLEELVLQATIDRERDHSS